MTSRRRTRQSTNEVVEMNTDQSIQVMKTKLHEYNNRIAVITAMIIQLQEQATTESQARIEQYQIELNSLRENQTTLKDTLAIITPKTVNVTDATNIPVTTSTKKHSGEPKHLERYSIERDRGTEVTFIKKFADLIEEYHWEGSELQPRFLKCLKGTIYNKVRQQFEREVKKTRQPLSFKEIKTIFYKAAFGRNLGQIAADMLSSFQRTENEPVADMNVRYTDIFELANKDPTDHSAISAYINHLGSYVKGAVLKEFEQLKKDNASALDIYYIMDKAEDEEVEDDICMPIYKNKITNNEGDNKTKTTGSTVADIYANSHSASVNKDANQISPPAVTNKGQTAWWCDHCKATVNHKPKNHYRVLSTLLLKGVISDPSGMAEACKDQPGSAKDKHHNHNTNNNYNYNSNNNYRGRGRGRGYSRYKPYGDFNNNNNRSNNDPNNHNNNNAYNNNYYNNSRWNNNNNYTNNNGKEQGKKPIEEVISKTVNAMVANNIAPFMNAIAAQMGNVPPGVRNASNQGPFMVNQLCDICQSIAHSRDNCPNLSRPSGRGRGVQLPARRPAIKPSLSMAWPSLYNIDTASVHVNQESGEVEYIYEQ